MHARTHGRIRDFFPSAYYGWNLGMLWILIKKPNGGEEQQQLEDALRINERVQGWQRERDYYVVCGI